MKRIVLAMLAFLLSSVAVFGQTNTTSFSGSVTDATGAVIPGVNVTITNKGTGNTSTATTKNDGNFAFEQLQPGTYDVKVVASGFSEAHETVDVLVATPKKVLYKLTAGASDVIINVETNLAEVNTSDATLGKSFNSAQVQNLPYLANNVTYLLSLQPGVLALDSGGANGGLNTDTRTGIVNGARQDQSNITLDGVDNNDQVFGYAFNGALRSTRDSVEEFRVTTTNSNADAGRSSGAQVSLVTRSGTNAFHGSAYEYYRDPAAAGNNWFIKQAELSSGSPNIPAKVLQHTFGASLGLPLLKDKLFFFGAYEGFKQSSDVSVGQTVPSAFTTNGAAAGLVTGNVTYQATDKSYKTLTPTDIAQMDGTSSDPACAKVTCYAPVTNDAAIAYFKQFPLANAPGNSDSLNVGNYNFASPAPISQITNIVRLDYNITPKMSVFVRGNLQSDNQLTPEQFLGGAASSSVYGNSKGIAVGHIWSINDKMTNNARYGLSRVGSASRGTGSQPFINFGAFSTLTAATTSYLYKVTTNNFADDFTYVKGRHTIQAGTNLYFISNGQYFDQPLLSTGYVSPNLLSTAAIANQGGSLDPAAFNCANCAPVDGTFQSFYNSDIISNVGAIETASSGTEFQVKGNTLVPLSSGNVPTHTFKNIEQEYYIQDQWKATSHLTLTAGLRYVYLGVPYEKDGQQIAPDISLNTFFANRASAAAQGQAYDTDVSFRASGSPNGQPNFWSAQKANLAPRIAFAYATPDNKTSIRGGFALSFDHFGTGVIDSYQSNSSSLFSLSKTNLATFTNIDSNPRFTGYHDVPAPAGATDVLQLPFTPEENPFTFDHSINDKQKTPYAETFNLTVQHEFPKSISVTASYVGRLGRHLLQNLDVAMPTNLYDSGSGQTYFQAATAFDKMVDAGVDPSTVPDSGYFHNIFPNLQFNGYQGAQAYYALFAVNRGNETNALYIADTDPTTSAAGQSFRYFYPQTSSIYVQSTTGVSNYHAMQLSVRQALRSGLEYDVNYTFSKSIDEGSDPERNGSGGSSILNSFMPHQWYANSDFDVRHNITANYTAPFPIGLGKIFLNRGGMMDRIFGGFQLNGVVHYSTGLPFSAIGYNGWATNFANNSNMVQIGPIATGGHHYDSANFVETALKGITGEQAKANLRFAYVGEAGQRNNFRSDGYLAIDDGLAKSFHTWREQQFRISVEVFNVINTNRFATPNMDGTTSAFGTYENSAGQSANTTTNQPGTSSLLLQPRQMQFSGKYTF